MHGQREEILTGFYAFSGNNSSQHLGFAHSSQYGTIGLTGDTAGFQSDGLITELEGFDLSRSEERRVGKECGTGGSAEDEEKKVEWCEGGQVDVKIEEEIYA